MRALLAFATRRSHFLVALVLAMVALAPSLSAQTDVIRGKVTTVEGLPLAGVRVTATSLPGNVTRDTRTDQRGSFQIVFPGGPGDYIMGYALIGYVFRQFEIKRMADEDVLIADAKLSVIQLDTVSVTASVQQRVNRNQGTPDVSGTEQAIASMNLPPELQGDLAAMAASLPGVVLIPGLDGAADGFSVMGLGADQNSITLNGQQFSASGLPRDALISSSLSTSSFDPSRGGFSGGNFNIRSGAGSNFRSRGLSLVVNTPQLEWTDRAARALGAEYTNVSLGGLMSGPIQRNKSFYNVSYQFGRRSSDNQTLLSAGPLGLQTAGVAQDSVTRFVSILQNRGLPSPSGSLRPNKISDNGSLFGSVDLSPPSSTSGSSYGLTFNGNWSRQNAVGASATQLSSASGDRTSWGGGIQARHSGYFGMILTESNFGVSASRDYGDPYLDLPSGRVRVNSLFDDGGSGVQMLSFGGSQSLSSSSRSVTTNFQNSLSWFDDRNKHRIKLGTELQHVHNTQDLASNLLGTFVFNSLEDLEAGRPASFSRTLTARQRSTGQIGGALSLGDSYRRSPDLQLQYGLRLDASRFTTTPTFNPAVEAAFQRRNDRVPTPITISPRLGFSYTLGTAPEINPFIGAARAPRAVVRGGIGMFANNTNANQIGAALDNTGLASGSQQIVCVGDAAPIPNWAAYASNPSAVPDRCADGTTGTVFANTSPNVYLVSTAFRPQRTVRSNLSWNGSILDARFSANVEGTYSVNFNQQRTVDINFNPQTRFSLADDGRPVFVQTTSIVPTTGIIAASDARMSQAFARVSELRSDLRSNTAQLTVRLSPITRTVNAFTWSAAYTFSRIREQVSGFSSTSGDPLAIEWATAGQGPHSFNYNLRYTFMNAVQINWTGMFRSGSAFTPMIAGDVNGDGYSNDRAFVYSPTPAIDPAIAAGMQSLLAQTTGATRSCLEKQLGHIAARNSCRGPWSSTASLNVSLDRAKFRMPQRAQISFSLLNPLGAADLAMHGSNKLRGWGQTPFPDQALLYVRGFDPQTRTYTYEVNQRFGATRPQFLTLRSPVTLTASMRIDLGAMRERQNLIQQLDFGRHTPGARYPEGLFRQVGANAVLNPMGAILRQQDSLRLTSTQADSIASMNRRYAYRSDSVWAPVSRYFASLPADYQEDEAYDRYLGARKAQVDLLMRIGPAIRDLLTPEQRRKLPLSVLNALDSRYLVSIRSGTGLYVSGNGFSSPGLGDFRVAAMGAPVFTEFSVIR
jgi:hypothetical protein